MRRRSASSGFSLTELLFVSSIFVVLAGIAVPTTLDVTQSLRVSGAARELERELQTARLKAVQSNRALRVRFDCPAPGRYRRVEVMNVALDSSTARCSEASYPFPSTRDTNPATPAHDGPVRYLPEGMTTSLGGQAIEFRSDGRAFLVSGSVPQIIGNAGVPLTVSKGTYSKTVAINGLGRIQIQ
jgi:prepilin-type N-terminal cleavage/methylation domain-containing protein